MPLKLHCILRASNISLKALALFYIASNLHLIYLIYIWNFGLLLVIADWQTTCCARIVQLGYVFRHCRPAKVVAMDNISWMTIYEIYVVSQYTISIHNRKVLSVCHEKSSLFKRYVCLFVCLWRFILTSLKVESRK